MPCLGEISTVPFTFTAHLIPVLPLTRWRWLSPLVLIAGTIAPDLGFLAHVDRQLTHGAPGLLWSSLVALVLAAWLSWLVLPVLARTVPACCGIDWPSLLSRNQLGRADAAPAVVRLPLSALLGVGTHLAWDSVTHPQVWPARAIFPPGPVTPWGWDAADLAWWVSTVLGTLVLLLLLRRWFPGPLRPRGGHPRRLWLLCACGVAVLLGCTGWALVHGPKTDLWWWLSVNSTRVGFAVLSLFCLLVARRLHVPASSADETHTRAQTSGSAALTGQ